MNRYITKAKRKDNGEWVYGYYVKSNFKKAKQKHYITISDVNPYSSYCKDEMQVVLKEIIPETLCQCTGLQDRDGNYIFENDIVKFDSIETFIVKYDYTSFKLEQIDKQYCDEMSMFYHRIPTMFEVIGNKFDKEVE